MVDFCIRHNNIKKLYFETKSDTIYYNKKYSIINVGVIGEDGGGMRTKWKDSSGV
jgi:hypothetical protein